jgi:hypothetical protein
MTVRELSRLRAPETAELTHMSIGPCGMAPAFRVPVALDDVREGDVWVDPSGVEWTASKPSGLTCVFLRQTASPNQSMGMVLADHPSTHGWRRKGDGA